MTDCVCTVEWTGTVCVHELGCGWVLHGLRSKTSVRPVQKSPQNQIHSKMKAAILKQSNALSNAVSDISGHEIKSISAW